MEIFIPARNVELFYRVERNWKNYNYMKKPVLKIRQHKLKHNSLKKGKFRGLRNWKPCIYLSNYLSIYLIFYILHILSILYIYIYIYYVIYYIYIYVYFLSHNFWIPWSFIFFQIFHRLSSVHLRRPCEMTIFISWNLIR